MHNYISDYIQEGCLQTKMKSSRDLLCFFQFFPSAITNCLHRFHKNQNHQFGFICHDAKDEWQLKAYLRYELSNFQQGRYSKQMRDTLKLPWMPVYLLGSSAQELKILRRP